MPLRWREGLYLVLVVVLLVLALLAAPREARASTAAAWEETADGRIVFSAADTLAAIEAVDPAYRGWVQRIIRCETAGTYAPGIVGDGGWSVGVAQIHARYQLGHYLAVGYTDRANPYQATDYLWRALRGDFARDGIGPWRWSCK